MRIVYGSETRPNAKLKITITIKLDYEAIKKYRKDKKLRHWVSYIVIPYPDIQFTGTDATSHYHVRGGTQALPTRARRRPPLPVC